MNNRSSTIVQELAVRLQAVRAILEKERLDALLVYSHTAYPANVRYLANHEPSIGDASVIVWPERPPTLLTAFGFDLERARVESDFDDSHTTQGGDYSIIRALEAGSLSESGRLGVVGFHTLPHSAFLKIQARWPEIVWVEVSREFEALRLHKTAYEVEMLKRAGSITAAAMKAVHETAGEGVSEFEVVAAADAAARKLGSERWAFQPSVFSGPDTTIPIAFSSDRKLERGDLVVVDMGAIYAGYSSDHTRVFVVGEPSSEQQALYDAVMKTHEMALAMVRPGVRMQSIHQTAHDLLVSQGYVGLTHRVGHGVGLETSLEAPDLMRDEGEVEEGMVFCIEPGVYIQGLGGVRVEDTLVVTADGYELLADYPHGLHRV